MNAKLSTFEKSFNKTMELFNKIEKRTGWKKDHEITYKVLRAVLHTLRDRLQLNEVAKFGSQLPLLMRGVYYEGWDPAKNPVKMNKEEFLQRIQQETYIAQDDPQAMVHEVLQGIEEYLSPGTMEKIKKTLPKDFAGL